MSTLRILSLAVSTCSVALEKCFSANLSCWIACFLNFIFCREKIKWNIVIASDLEFYFHRRSVPSTVAILGHHHRRSSSTTNAIACHRRLSLRQRGLLSSLTVSIVGDYYPRWLSLRRDHVRGSCPPPATSGLVISTTTGYSGCHVSSRLVGTPVYLIISLLV